MAPHALYTTSEDIFRSCRLLAHKYRRPLMTHLSETLKEFKDVLKKTNNTLTPTGLLKHIRVLDSGTFLSAVSILICDYNFFIERCNGVSSLRVDERV